ncbi:hypothetical protein B9Z19DRAFT_1136631 [Tuber borchii]|uniref:Uncharacterized protein n=1 Tax=Tuber borchii TaxID=42251 RepID=A0A2T6ZBE1_TUBBO|nr:hypothetical protein B9Z19DRAFT_1136631 [Tuber borchii]
MEGEGKGAAANPQACSSKTQISHSSATNSAPLQVGSSDQAATAQSGFDFGAAQDMGQFDQMGEGDGRFEQFQYDTQDCQDPQAEFQKGHREALHARVPLYTPETLPTINIRVPDTSSNAPTPSGPLNILPTNLYIIPNDISAPLPQNPGES